MKIINFKIHLKLLHYYSFKTKYITDVLTQKTSHVFQQFAFILFSLYPELIYGKLKTLTITIVTDYW